MAAAAAAAVAQTTHRHSATTVRCVLCCAPRNTQRSALTEFPLSERAADALSGGRARRQLDGIANGPPTAAPAAVLRSCALLCRTSNALPSVLFCFPFARLHCLHCRPLPPARLHCIAHPNAVTETDRAKRNGAVREAHCIVPWIALALLRWAAALSIVRATENAGTLLHATVAANGSLRV